jgi:hypothetical protein
LSPLQSPPTGADALTPLARGELVIGARELGAPTSASIGQCHIYLTPAGPCIGSSVPVPEVGELDHAGEVRSTESPSSSLDVVCQIFPHGNHRDKCH